MDPLHFCIAVAPLAVYLTLLGVINLSGRAFVTTGSRDAAALGIGLSGLMVAGPMELFFPANAALWAGVLVWPLLLTFYGLCVSLIVLMMRPRLVIYNINYEKIRPILGDLANQLDSKSRWSGDNLFIPAINVHLHLEANALLSNIQLVASGPRQSYEGWRKLELKLRSELRDVRTRPNALGLGLLIVSGLIASVTAFWMISDQQEIAKLLRQMLRI